MKCSLFLLTFFHFYNCSEYPSSVDSDDIPQFPETLQVDDLFQHLSLAQPQPSGSIHYPSPVEGSPLSSSPRAESPRPVPSNEVVTVSDTSSPGMSQSVSESPPGGEKYTSCEKEVGVNGNGRYPNMIAQEFYPEMVIATGSNRNLYCQCLTNTRMYCIIYVKPRSIQEILVNRRLDLEQDPQILLPFFIMPQSESGPNAVFFALRDCLPRIFCQIYIQQDANTPQAISVESSQQEHYRMKRSRSFSTDSRTYSPQGARESSLPIARSNSSPHRIRFPPRSISLLLCGDAVCPITQDPFKDNDIVYVLKEESEHVTQRKSVICFSAKGLNQLATKQASNQFEDPFRRKQGSPLSISTDYDAYRVVDERLHPPGSGPTEEVTQSGASHEASEAGPSSFTRVSPTRNARSRENRKEPMREDKIQKASNTSAQIFWKHIMWLMIFTSISFSILLFAPFFSTTPSKGREEYSSLLLY